MLFRKENFKTERRLMQLPIDSITPSENQPRRNFDEYELSLLADSIKQNGLLQPVSVRKSENGYELIAGERRLRASKMAGLNSVPALVYEISREAAAVYTLIENLQREDLSPFDEAEGIKRLITVYKVSQCDAAERLGIAQSTLSNKLRILRLSEEQRKRIEAASLSERHARALLKISEDKRDSVLDKIIADALTVKETENLVEELLSGPKKTTTPLRRGAVGDVRLFANSLKKIVDTMSKTGYTVKTKKSETDSYIEYTVRIDKTSAQLRLI